MIKQTKFDNEQDWLAGRRGKITGTRAGSMLSKRDNKPLKTFYEVIAERIAIPSDGENAIDRGKRLEHEAIERFEKETGKVVDKSLVLWTREDEESIAVSPDGFIGDTEAVECKCLNSASHIEALITGKIPSEYEYQVLQYFVVNDDLKTLYFIFYDPRMPRDYVCFTIERDSIAEKVATSLEEQREVLKKIKEIENQIIAF
ncbi:MAG: YqaJ viral recombinase family protein [Patescibacteria group bacterium]|nr:YqaJ viral recombinase family protein [Patescibacteria group bacterium]MDE2439276.1 YqaJ viral recombinase family protein [Patescibacteria group bacterium]